MIKGTNGWGIMTCSNVGLSRRHKVNAASHWFLAVAIVTTWSTLLSLTTALPLDEFYPFDLTNDNQTQVKDDGGSPLILLEVDFPFFNTSENGGLYVNNNGIISFRDQLTQYKPLNFNNSKLQNNIPIIAPFWGDVDIYNVNGLNETIRFRLTNESAVLNRSSKDVRNHFIGQKDFSAKQVLIVTWYKVGYYGASGDGKSKRNTFQAVLITDGLTSYVVFNYNETVWTTGSNSVGESETGLGGEPAVVGFDSGRDGYFYLLTGSGTDAIINVTDGSNIDVPGKYLFKVDGVEIEDLHCAASDTLTIEPTVVSMLGRELIRVRGPCLSEGQQVTAVIKELTIEFPCVVSSDLRELTAICVTPSLFKTGEFKIEFVAAGSDRNYSTNITSVHLLNMPQKLIRANPERWQIGENTVNWKVTWLETSTPRSISMNLSLMAYSDTNGREPKLEKIQNDQGDTVSDLNVIANQTQRLFKVRSINSKHDTLIMRLCWSRHSRLYPVCIWSDVFPVRWIVRQKQKSEEWCENWLTRESGLKRINIHSPYCPCVASIAENDVGHFQRDPICDNAVNSANSANIANSAKNCIYNPNAHTCFRRNIKRSDDSGETCCYNADGNLMDIRESVGAGTHQRYHYKAQGETIVPYFSYFVSDLLPRTHCCQLSDKNCSDFIRYRNATSCQDYSPPSPALAAGDPHIVTLDGYPYSFNGVGDYFLVRDNATSTVIQVRAVRAKDENNTLQNATVFSTVAVGVLGASDTVEIRQNNAKAEKYDVLVNGLPVHTTPSSTSQFKNISLVNNDNGSFLIVLEPVSISITVEVTSDLVNIIVLIGEESMKGSVRGLLGNYNNNMNDDLIPRYSPSPLEGTASMRDIHYYFGLTWAVNANESILTPTNDIEASNSSFEPVFIDEEESDASEADQAKVEEICKGNTQCEFDYKITGKESIAMSTAAISTKFEETKSQLNEKVVRCPYLETPPNGNKTQNGSTEFSVAIFTCDPGYELMEGSRKIDGSVRRVCQANNTWSGSGVACAISTAKPNTGNTHVNLLLIAAASGAGGMFLIIVAVGLIIYCRKRRAVKPPDTQIPVNIPMSDFPSPPEEHSVFDNEQFIIRLQSIGKGGKFNIPRPRFTDPQIFEDFF